MIYTKVTETPFLNALAVNDPRNVEQRFSIIHVEKGQILFHQGDSAETMCIIKEGELVKSFESETRSFVLSHHYPGDVLGEAEILHTRQRRFATLKAIKRSSLWSIDSEQLHRLLLEFPILNRRLFDIVGDRFFNASRKIAYLAFMDARTRLVHLLNDYVSDHSLLCEKIITWKITQQEMGDLVGLNRESVARVLSELQTQKILRVKRGLIHIEDLSALHQLAQKTADNTFQHSKESIK